MGQNNFPTRTQVEGHLAWKNCPVFATLYLWNGTCLPKPLCAKLPLLSVGLHTVNFDGTARCYIIIPAGEDLPPSGQEEEQTREASARTEYNLTNITLS